MLIQEFFLQKHTRKSITNIKKISKQILLKTQIAENLHCKQFQASNLSETTVIIQSNKQSNNWLTSNLMINQEKFTQNSDNFYHILTHWLRVWDS